MKTELYFSVICHCLDGASICETIDCFNEVVSAFNPDVLHSAACTLNRLEDDSNDC